MANLNTVIHRLQQQRNQAARTLTRIDAAIAALSNHAGRPASTRTRRRLSAAARRRIAAAQKARWAKWRANRG